MPILLVQGPGVRHPRTFEVFKHYSTIGRGRDNDLVVDDPSMEETHALVRFDGGAFVMQGFGTATLDVNGREVRKHKLEEGDVIRLGGSRLEFRLFGEVGGSSEEGSELLEVYRTVHALSVKLLQAYETSALLEELLDAVIALTHADKGFLVLVDDGALDVRVARHVGQDALAKPETLISDSIVKRVVDTRAPLLISDAANDQAFSGSQSVVNLRLCSVLCVPLLDRSELLGVMYLGNDNVVSLFTEQHREAVTIFAAQASLILARALALDEIKDSNRSLQAQLEDMRFGTLIGACEAMQQVYRRVQKVAATDVSVLITGETGTGKELIAREIHNRSERAKGPFITINCGAIPENLLESELFGHVKGAFTGATANRAGKFHAANGGTLFLDEIGEMPINLQVKILRALQERTITRVGSNDPERVDIRVLAATHRDLKQRIADGHFREDLFYRLNVVPLHLPPLRERGDDIVLIAQYFLDRTIHEYRTPRRTFGREALVALRKAAWPGNIRQLENHVRKAVILSDGGSITPTDLDLADLEMRRIRPLAEAREEWQRRYISEVLELNDGNRTQTARDLGVDPRTIFRFLEKEGDRPDTDEDEG